MPLLTLAVSFTIADARLFSNGKPRVNEERDNLVERSLQHGGMTRWFLEHRPDTFVSFVNNTNSTSNAIAGGAVVILLHGGTSNMWDIFRRGKKGTRRWLELSDTNGILLLAPNADNPKTKDTKGYEQVWNDNREDERDTADDVGFLAALVRWAVVNRGVNPSRVYVTGASNGGIMTYQALLESNPPIYAAGAAFIANLPVTNVPLPQNRSTPIFIMNGNKDKLMNWEGGEIAQDRGVVISAVATRDFWLEVNKPDKGSMKKVTWPNRSWLDGCRVFSEEYPAKANETGGADVHFYTMDGGGHVVPYTEFGLYPLTYRLFGGPMCREVDGADLAWDFTKRFNLIL